VSVSGAPVVAYVVQLAPVTDATVDACVMFTAYGVFVGCAVSPAVHERHFRIRRCSVSENSRRTSSKLVVSAALNVV